jgi:hypothetical protein
LWKVCRSFSEATCAKALWINLLEHMASDQGQVLPPCLKSRDKLDGKQLEALVVRVSQLARRWRGNDLQPVKMRRIDIQYPVTWLRLVSGGLLFVASSDNNVSKISCWDLSSIFKGFTEPIAEAYLPGKVQSARLEVQEGGVVLALGLGPKCGLTYSILLSLIRF